MAEVEARTETEALHCRIAERAYALWEQEGCPHGRDVDHWLQAETEVASDGTDREDVAAQPASGGKKPEKAAA